MDGHWQNPPVRNQHTPAREALTDIPPPEPMDGHWLPIPQIGDLATPPVKYTTVEMWRHRRRNADIPFPEPDDYIGSMPVWRLERIIAWFKATGRPYDLALWQSKRANGEYRRTVPKRKPGKPADKVVQVAKLYKRSLKVVGPNGKPLHRKAPWIQEQLRKAGEDVELTAVRNRLSRARAAGLID